MRLSLLLEVFWAIAGLSEFSPRGAEMEKNVVAFLVDEIQPENRQEGGDRNRLILVECAVY